MKPLLLIAHPGHELRIWEWVSKRRPHVLILTLGDGATGKSRLAASLNGLAARGIRVRTDWLVPVSDTAIYRALLGEARSPFPEWIARLKLVITRERITEIVADEAEGYNPTHDLCRAMANILVSRMVAEGHEVRNLEFPLVGHPCDPRRKADLAEELTLDPEALHGKIAAMRAYGVASQQPRLCEEGEAALQQFGEAAFAQECLYVAQPAYTHVAGDAVPPPHFETVGEQRQAAGYYKQVIRARHVQALVSGMQSTDASTVNCSP